MASVGVKRSHDANDSVGHDLKRSNTNAQSNSKSWIQLRCLVSASEAAALINGKGETISKIKQLTGVRSSFSENIRGTVERILTVSGSIEGVAEACGLLVRTVDDESIENGSQSESTNERALRMVVPHQALGPIIGRTGNRITEIKQTTGATINISDSLLPLSTERAVVIKGTADVIQQAIEIISRHLYDQTEKLSMTHIQHYNPLPACGVFGRDNHWRNQVDKNVRTPFNPYGVSPNGYSASDYANTVGITNGGSTEAQASTKESAVDTKQQRNTVASTIIPHVGTTSLQAAQQQAQQQAAHSLPGQQVIQQIYIPNDMVGAIIGKGGMKINEIRQLSGSSIKINEQQENSNERLVTITGTSDSNRKGFFF
ncbi:hypothetical protein V1514DRAFT_341409 [Lipomyces japonicus]|uniref:uncharacterized protein n=1 Tax=Lipomyces japonicus TaxID=56871 RepID=UPI0034CEA919